MGADDIFSFRGAKRKYDIPCGYDIRLRAYPDHICADGANISYRAEPPRGISYAAAPRISYPPSGGYIIAPNGRPASAGTPPLDRLEKIGYDKGDGFFPLRGADHERRVGKTE